MYSWVPMLLGDLHLQGVANTPLSHSGGKQLRHHVMRPLGGPALGPERPRLSDHRAP